MHAPAAAAQLDWMPQVKHLVVDEIFHGVTWHFSVIEDLADHNGVVGGVIVAQAPARVVAAPGHLRASHETVKESRIQIVKDLLQVVVASLWSQQPLAPAHLADEMGFGGNALAAGEFTEASCMLRINLFAVELGNQDMKNGVQNRLRST